MAGTGLRQEENRREQDYLIERNMMGRMTLPVLQGGTLSSDVPLQLGSKRKV